MKITLSTLAALLALGLPAHAEMLTADTLANGTPVQHISSSIIMLGEAAEAAEPEEAAPAVKRVEEAKTVASMSLDEIIGERPPVMNERGEMEAPKETETAKAKVSEDSVEPVTADAAAPAPSANDADKVTVMRPGETDSEATASISTKAPVENQGEVKPGGDEPQAATDEMRPTR